MSALSADGLNAVVAGAGGIGGAVATALLERYEVEQLFVLQRSQRPALDDPRVTYLAVDATAPDTIARAGEAVAARCSRLHLVFNAVGLLHAEGLQPEKRLRDVTADALLQLATVNAYFLPQLAAALAPLLRHGAPSLLASLSARVGSITDNGMGGWYSYRASKAAHNMLLKTLAREWKVSHKHCAVVALHPGTVETPLSQPFTPANYQKRVLRPAQSANALLDVLEQVGVEQSGRFFAWDGQEIPW